MIAEAKIRPAADADVQRIIELGRTYLLEGPYRDQIRDNPETVRNFISWIFEQNNARILVYEEEGEVRGVFGFLVFPHYYGGELCANELIWCVEKEYRGRASFDLLYAAEKMAFEMGAVRMALTAPTREIGSFYEHLKGYKLVEVGYQALLRNRVKRASD